MMTRLLGLLAALTTVLPVAAEVVQLSRPGEMVMTLQPGSARALVRETRTLQLPAGDSAVGFSWNKANVDPSSVTLALERGTVGEASRAPGQDRALVWQVNMPQAGATVAVVSYLLDGAKWQPSYVLTLDPAAGKAVLEGSVRLTNETGAALQQVSLQMGAPGTTLADRPEGPQKPARPFAAPATIEPGATAVLTFTVIPDIPATVRYVYQPDRSGNVEQVLRLGLDQVGVPAIALPDGPMVIEQAGEPPVPVFKTQLDLQPDREFEVSMGTEPDIVVERRLVSSRRGNFDVDRFGRITGVDTTEEYLLTVRNHLGRNVTLDVVETVLSTWDLKGPDPARRETSWVQWGLPAPAGQAAELRFSLVKHAGTRAKK